MKQSSRKMVTEIFAKNLLSFLISYFYIFLGPKDERLTGQQGVHTEVVSLSNLDLLETLVLSDPSAILIILESYAGSSGKLSLDRIQKEADKKSLSRTWLKKIKMKSSKKLSKDFVKKEAVEEHCQRSKLKLKVKSKTKNISDTLLTKIKITICLRRVEYHQQYRRSLRQRVLLDYLLKNLARVSTLGHQAHRHRALNLIAQQHRALDLKAQQHRAQTDVLTLMNLYLFSPCVASGSAAKPKIQKSSPKPSLPTNIEGVYSITGSMIYSLSSTFSPSLTCSLPQCALGWPPKPSPYSSSFKSQVSSRPKSTGWIVFSMYTITFYSSCVLVYIDVIYIVASKSKSLSSSAVSV